MLEQMQEKKVQMLMSLMNLRTAILDAQSKIEGFYSPMRWENLGLSQEDYEALYSEGKIYDLKEADIINVLESLKNSLNEILKQ